MRNPIGRPLEIFPLKNADVKYGWRVVDPVNKVNYDVTEEPWATICATAYSNQGREPFFTNVRVVYEGANPSNKSYLTDYDDLAAAGLVFTTVSDLMAFLYSVDFHGHNLTIEFLGEIPDMWIYTDRLISCGRMYLHFVGIDPADDEPSDTTTGLNATNACISKCCGIRIYGPVTTYVSGSIRLQYDAKGMCDLFYLENSYVHFTNLQILIDRCTDAGGWQPDPNISYPALILGGMNSKMEFNNRMIICFGGGGNITTRTWPFYLIMCVNYAYALVAAACQFTLRHLDNTKLWTFSSKPPFMATRFALIRMSASAGGGWGGAFTLGDGLTGCQASVNGYIDTSARMSAILNGSGLKTGKETTQGQVRFG